MTSHQMTRKELFLERAPAQSLKVRLTLPLIILILILSFALTTFHLIMGRTPVELLIIAIISFLALIGLRVLITRRIIRRIDQITRAAERVARGDFRIRIDDNGDDEVGRLVQAFNKMVADLDRLHRSRDLLSRTMSPQVRKSLIEHGLDFRGLTKDVAVLFVDIRGFTRMTEKYNTEQLVFFLNDYYTTIANQVHSGDGIIGKYGGDSILAYFGALDPQPPSKSAMSALLTALALQDAIEIMSERWCILGMPPIQVGIGISFGPVVAGPIGSEEQFEYTVIGDAVNLASRLQDLTRNLSGYGIMISAELYEALDDSVKDQIQVLSSDYYESLGEKEKIRRPILFVDLGPVLVKGKKGPVEVYGIPDPGRT